MSQFLSPAWLAELGAAAAASGPLRAAAAGVRLTVRHVVTGGPDGDVEYRVRFADGRVEVDPGPGEADVEVHQDYETAAAVSAGRLTPAAAFGAGRMRIGGRPGLLAEHRDTLGRLGDVFEGVRSGTTY
ncbi:MAG: SCP2 sterol-binding domain-containing protein [Acidimicrobiia bacterium]